MPQFVLKTNVPKCQIPKDFWTKTTEIVANMLEKPAAATMVGLWRSVRNEHLIINHAHTQPRWWSSPTRR